MAQVPPAVSRCRLGPCVSKFHCTLECEICSKPYALPRSTYERGQSKFCSRECHGIATAQKYKSRRRTLVCLECGDKYERNVSSSLNSSFCSRVCQNRAQARSLRGEQYSKTIADRGRLVFDPEDEQLRSRVYFNQFGRPTVNIDGRRVQLSRLVLSLAGVNISSLVVDHANGDFTDNRKANLRPCSRSENSCNRHKNRTKIPGVIHNPRCRTNPYRVQIAFDGRIYSLPWVSDRERAIALRNHVAKQMQGDFAVMQITSYRLSVEDFGWVIEHLAVKTDHRKKTA